MSLNFEEKLMSLLFQILNNLANADFAMANLAIIIIYMYVVGLCIFSNSRKTRMRKSILSTELHVI